MKKMILAFCLALVLAFSGCQKEKNGYKTRVEMEARSERLLERAKQIPTNIPVLLDDQNFNGVFVSVYRNTHLSIYIFNGTNKCIRYG
jgi:hypothetical protein